MKDKIDATLNVCPELDSPDFVFRFKGQCPISTCQYCNGRTSRGCLTLDRKESSDKTITAKEIIYYKGSVFPELTKFDSKQAEACVRKAQGRTRATISLYFYMRELDTRGGIDKSFEFVSNRSHAVDTVHNYLAQTFTEFRNWMLPYLADEERFVEYTQTFQHSDVNLGSALRLPPKKFQTFCSAMEYLYSTPTPD